MCALGENVATKKRQGEQAPEPVEQRVPPDQANAIDDMNEDVPFKPAPQKNLPPLHDLPEPEKENHKAGKKDKYDEAMKILDDYYKGVPVRNPTLEHEED
jgi:hypothetical protein